MRLVQSLMRSRSLLLRAGCWVVHTMNCCHLDALAAQPLRWVARGQVLARSTWPSPVASARPHLRAQLAPPGVVLARMVSVKRVVT